MHINVNFTLNINPNEWEGRASGVPTAAVDINDPDTWARIRKEVRAHAENVICDLYTDMGWIVEQVDA
jgi:23S rRNA U2552 (ribose-2'-O)-methylase RlmE/FtsJ